MVVYGVKGRVMEVPLKKGMHIGSCISFSIKHNDTFPVVYITSWDARLCSGFVTMYGYIKVKKTFGDKA